MDVVHNDDDLERLEFDPRFTANLSQGLVRAYRKKMQAIRGAKDERDLRTQKSNHFEELQGKRKGQHSIRLNEQYRLIIQLLKHKKGDQRKKVKIINIEDYHQ
jgi:proteic killer suppression protein